MKIGIVTQSFFPVRGGVSQHVYHTANELKNRGHQVTVITANYTPFDSEHDHGLDVIRLGLNVTIPANGSYAHFTVGRHLRRKLQLIQKNKQFDIVHIHTPLDPILPLLATKTFTCPKVGTYHTSTATGHNIIYDYFSRLWRNSHKKIDGNIVVSKNAREFINQYFPGDYHIIPNGVDNKRFNPTNQPLPGIRQNNDPLIVSIGRLSPRKGIRYIVAAMPHVIDKIPRARLVVVGGGFLKTYYQNMVLPRLKDRVRFTGYATESELPQYYAAADICVFPSTGAESFGIVLIEAMAAGKPVIASNIPGYNAVVSHDRDGFLTQPRNPKALAQALVDLLNDKERQRRYINQGLKTAEKFSWENVVDMLEKLYREIISAKK
ncbi:glycosyltransferase family 4 protein [Patescibacteria group bacterium]